jgi:hypothetical protein
MHRGCVAQCLAPGTATAVKVGGKDDADGGEDDLNDQFDPVEATGVGDP